MRELRKGMPVVAGAWHGRVERVLGAVVVCVAGANGTSTRRSYARRDITVAGDQAVVDKRARLVTCGREPGAECGLKNATECSTHGERAGLERGWDRATLR